MECKLTNVYCFGTNDLPVNKTENSDFQNLDKNLSLLPTLTFIYAFHKKHLANLTVEVEGKKKSRGWGRVLVSDS